MSNRDRAVEVMRSFWNDGRYAVGFDEIAEALADAGVLAPEPASPRTMAEIEWDDKEHHLAEATAAWTEGHPSNVVMLNKFGKKITVYQSASHYSGLRELNPGILTPTGRKYRLEPEDDTPTPPTEDKLTPEQQALARDIFGSFPNHDPEHKHVHWAKHIPESAASRPEDVPVGEPWQVEVDGQEAIGYRNDPESRLCWAVLRRDDSGLQWTYDANVTLIARLVPETTEQDDGQVLDPDYTYRDKDGDVWEYQTRTMRWRCYPEIGVSFEVTGCPPTERVPYTRVEKENHDH